MEMLLNRNVKLRELNEHITCFMCGGYLVDATTITECIHTFCRSCLLSHIEDENYNCPKCNILIHHSHPLQYIAHDRTMQDIVDKLVPNLRECEWGRRVKFYTENKMPIPTMLNLNNGEKCAARLAAAEDGKSHNYHRNDEQIDLYLRSSSCSLKHLKRPFIQCSVHATIKILKKFLAKNLGLGIHHHTDLDILCNDEILGKDHTLMFIMVTRWRSKKPPLHLEYRPSIALL